MKKKLVRSKSQEEAAVVIQKHYRGYQVRNKIDSPNNQLDISARKLLKAFCKKWKSKSIYQVILLDRANKLQDVVYFSLQVHMYNQHVVCNLNNTKHQPVVLANVMSATGVNDFLGGKKCYSYKIPFQLKMDPTIDRNPLTLDENMTGDADYDQNNWDSPLNRFPEARVAFKILKHSFAVRDQGVQVGMCERAPSDSKTEYKQLYMQKYEENPSKQSAVDCNGSYNATETKRQKIVTATTRPKTTTKPPDRSNPVLELQLKGKQYRQTAADANEDDPPYNFQGILKKTDYSKRRSLKEARGRTAQREQSYSSSGREEHYCTVDRSEETAKITSKDHKNELNQLLYEATRTELWPGVVLEGSSCDL